MTILIPQNCFLGRGKWPVSWALWYLKIAFLEEVQSPLSDRYDHYDTSIPGIDFLWELQSSLSDQCDHYEHYDTSKLFFGRSTALFKWSLWYLNIDIVGEAQSSLSDHYGHCDIS